MSMTLLEMTSARRGSLRRVSGPAALRRAARERGGEQARHVPTLARELLELLDPQPGQCAIDCTFGDGGHARLVAERLGPSGTLVAIDRDPVAEEGFARLEREVPCAVRFIRAGYAEAIARAIVRRRSRAPIATTLELVEAINSAVPAPARFGGGHPAKRSFQALRIAVNDELGQLDRALPRAWGLLRPGGSLAAISF